MSAVSKKENARPSRAFSDLMTTILKAALAQRAVRISTDPRKTAREITATQFRPQTKETSDAIERDITEHRNG
jgi:hypothetical protein